MEAAVLEHSVVAVVMESIPGDLSAAKEVLRACGLTKPAQSLRGFRRNCNLRRILTQQKIWRQKLPLFAKS
ncbi:MAG TPA: hypothetical protein DCX79_00725 [Planctomycetaceae bacterium]|nr:hypothetical protein [Planctomycetaceae bacterium]